MWNGIITEKDRTQFDLRFAVKFAFGKSEKSLRENGLVLVQVVQR